MNNHAETLAQYMALDYRATVVPDMTTDGRPCYFARNPELPGCVSHGFTPGEALENLREVRELHIGSLLEDGLAVPLPESPGKAVSDGDRRSKTMSIPRRVVWEVIRPSAAHPRVVPSQTVVLRGQGARGRIQAFSTAA